MRTILFISFLIGSISLISSAQLPADFQLLSSVVKKNEVKKFSHSRDYGSEYDWLIGELFFVYKSFVSSQDGNTCTFTPSCSTYGVQAVRQQGLIIGSLNFFDRFSRCHGLNSEDYQYEPQSNLLIDPIKDHNFK